MPPFEAFALGSLRISRPLDDARGSGRALADDGGWRLTGPGVAGEGRCGAGPLPADILDAARRNHALFPVASTSSSTCGDRLAAIPRSTLVEA